MSHVMQQVKVVPMIAPGVIKDDAAYTCAVCDALGWDYATAVFHIGATDIAVAVMNIQDADDNSTYGIIDGANFANTSHLDITGTALALPDANADNTIILVHLDLKKRKRYLQAAVTAGNGSAGTYMSGVFVLSRGEAMPDTAAEAGASIVVVV